MTTTVHPQIPLPSKKLSPIEAAKQLAAQRAVADHFSPHYTYVGIGSGSTVVYVVQAIAAFGPAVTSKIVFVPTGFQSRELIVEAGLPLGAIDSLVPHGELGRKEGEDHLEVATGKQGLGLKGERVMLDVAFDGADEVDEDLNCIKGGGACLFQEKLVATSARKFVCVAGTLPYSNHGIYGGSGSDVDVWTVRRFQEISTPATYKVADDSYRDSPPKCPNCVA